MITPRWWDDKTDAELADLLARYGCPMISARYLAEHRTDPAERHHIGEWIDGHLGPFRDTPPA